MPQTNIVGTSPVTRGRGYNEQLSNRVEKALGASYLRFGAPEAALHPGLTPKANGDTDTVMERALAVNVARQNGAGGK